MDLAILDLALTAATGEHGADALTTEQVQALLVACHRVVIALLDE